MAANNDTKIINELTNKKYPYGFVSDLDSDTISKGLGEDTVRIISQKKMNHNGCLRNVLMPLN